MFTKGKKTALVTGASSGIGKDIAERFMKDGFQVFVAARSVEKMNDLATLGAQPLRLDVSKEDEIKAAVGTILAETGGFRSDGPTTGVICDSIGVFCDGRKHFPMLSYLISRKHADAEDRMSGKSGSSQGRPREGSDKSGLKPRSTVATRSP